ncbi:unnamed protein product [Symbiodinium natans]|uniref:Uncharacterized protein n=1 Tax=Symbiodinium natans TaxID=878477 RepID=A0A812RRC5_9DINO|nr:unnamed protein product [Symbiodinium natans]
MERCRDLIPNCSTREASEGLTLRVAEALARHVEEIHDKRVAADVDLVASALVAHLEGVTARRAADAVAKAEEAGRQPEEAGPDLQEAVVEEHEDVDSLHSDAVNMETVASVLASLLGLPQDESPRSESIQEHEAVDSEHTDDANVQAVAEVLAGLVAAADLGSFAGVQAGSCAPPAAPESSLKTQCFRLNSRSFT